MNTVFDAACSDVVRSLHATPAFQTSSQTRQFAHDLLDAEGSRSFAQSRATNFHLASRSFRVRGVLVGREHGAQVLAVSDMHWTIGAPREGESTAVAIALQAYQRWQRDLLERMLKRAPACNRASD